MGTSKENLFFDSLISQSSGRSTKRPNRRSVVIVKRKKKIRRKMGVRRRKKTKVELN